MTKAIQIHANGGPEVLRYEDVEVRRPGKGEALIRHTAIGVNFIDIYYRSGLYPPPAGLPLIPGSEAAGVVIETGEGVDTVKPGDRVAYAGPLGAYAEERVIAADRLVKIPDGISDEQAAAMMLKGMTVAYLLLRTHPVKPGRYRALSRGGRRRRADVRPVGQASRRDRHRHRWLAGQDGARQGAWLRPRHQLPRHAISSAAVKEITGGRMCDVVYDSVGKDTFPASLDCLKPMGLFVSFGQSSGPIPPFSMAILSQKGSLFATRPTLFTYIAKRADLEAYAAALFDVVGKGIVKVEINQRHALADAAQAHADIEARRTTGTSILIP